MNNDAIGHQMLAAEGNCLSIAFKVCAHVKQRVWRITLIKPRPNMDCLPASVGFPLGPCSIFESALFQLLNLEV